MNLRGVSDRARQRHLFAVVEVQPVSAVFVDPVLASPAAPNPYDFTLVGSIIHGNGALPGAAAWQRAAPGVVPGDAAMVDGRQRLETGDDFASGAPAAL